MERKQLIVLGAGESGVSAARLGQREGYAVFVSDMGPGSATYLAELDEVGIAYEVGGHTEQRILAADEVVKSPGIPDTAPLVLALRRKQIPVISEIEFAYRYVAPTAKIVAITGSNGKTTTTLLTHHLIEAAGIRSLAGGNLGESFARLVLDQPLAEVYVLELSSFQLDGIVEFRPHIAAILNITPDHLDRYDYQLEKYADSKFRIARNMSTDDHLLVLLDLKTLAPALRRSKVTTEVTTVVPSQDIDGSVIDVMGNAYDLTDTPLTGRHNAMNACFAIRMALLAGVDQASIAANLKTFVAAPHRMEAIPTSDGRRWINDSKATNVDSAYYALDAMDGPTIWIAGGTDKGNDYDALQQPVNDKVRALVCLGVDNHKLREAFGGKVRDVVECNSAARAVELAAQLSKPGDRILLSPACASFDLFKNYLDRGDQFRAEVQKRFA